MLYMCMDMHMIMYMSMRMYMLHAHAHVHAHLHVWACGARAAVAVRCEGSGNSDGCGWRSDPTAALTSPIFRSMSFRSGPQYGGIESRRVLMLDGPTTAHRAAGQLGRWGSAA